jgi:hypothetical protein
MLPRLTTPPRPFRSHHPPSSRHRTQRAARPRYEPYCKKAIVALAHRILVIIYTCGSEQQSYRELGPGHADEQAAESSKRWAIRRLEQLGFAVTLTPKDHESLTPTDHQEEVA